MSDANPLVAWGLGQAKRDKRGFIFVALFLVGFYGIVLLAAFGWSTGFTRRIEELLTMFHYIAWAVCGILLLLWAPTRMAQAIAKEKEQGTLDMLRLTGMRGEELAVGYVATCLSLPLLLASLTIPVILMGIGGEGGPEATLRGFIPLLLLCPVYVMLGGLAGLGVKRAQHAGSAALFTILVLLFFSGSAVGDHSQEMTPFAILGPWGGGLAATSSNPDWYVVEVFGHDVPGDLLQIPFLVILARALLLGLARRFQGEPAVFLGRTGATVLVVAIAVVSAITFYPHVESSAANPMLPWFLVNRSAANRPVLAAHMIVLLIALILFAVESPIRWRDLIRGLARRDPDDLLQDEERLTPHRFLPGALVVGGFLFLVGLSMLHALFGAGWKIQYTQVTPVGLVIAASIVFGAWLVATLTFQAVQLWTRDKGAPRLLAGLAVLVLWMGPIMASYMLKEVGLPKALFELPRAINPFFGVVMAVFHTDTSFNTSGLDPLALALACAAVHFFLAIGLVRVIRMAHEQAVEYANSLVALPADAYGAPGSLTQRCAQGHLFSETWASCPHCAPAQRRELVAPEPEEPEPKPAPPTVSAPAPADQQTQVADLGADLISPADPND